MADNKMIGKRDLLLLLAVLLIGGIGMLLLFFRPAAENGTVEVTVDGAVYCSLPLSEDTRLDIDGYGGGTNRLVIENGSVYMEEASCPDGICVRHRRIEKNGENIICLPNRVVVTIRSREEGSVDAVA
jgi:hypothetical protein